MFVIILGDETQSAIAMVLKSYVFTFSTPVISERGMLFYCLFLLLVTTHTVSTTTAIPRASGSSLSKASSKQSGTTPVTVHIAADNLVRVYLNGERLETIENSGTSRSLNLNLRKDDVVAAIAQGSGTGHGIIMSVVGPGGEQFATGVNPARATAPDGAKNDGIAWMKPGHSVCHWPEAVLNSYVSISTRFPYGSSKAQYVWASNAGPSDTVYLRYSIGGEQCGDKREKHIINFAATSLARIYLNRERITTVVEHWDVKRLAVDLRKGDVIAVRPEDVAGKTGYGTIISIEDANGNHIVTGRDEWRAIKASPSEDNGSAWMLPSANVCHWPKAVINTIVDIAPTFPFKETGSQYVWASNAGEGDTIFLRHKIGGEDCTCNRVSGRSLVV